VPELDYAVLCDYVRTEGGIAHVIAAGIDTIWAGEIPTGQNIGLHCAIRLATLHRGSQERSGSTVTRLGDAC